MPPLSKRLKSEARKRGRKKGTAGKKKGGKKNKAKHLTPASASKRAGIIAVGIVIAEKRNGKTEGGRGEDEKGRAREPSSPSSSSLPNERQPKTKQWDRPPPLLKADDYVSILIGWSPGYGAK